MRTTVTLEPDVRKMIEEEMHRSRRSFKQVINQAVRRALMRGRSGPAPKRYRTVPHEARLVAGVDRGSLNHMADELHEQEFVAPAAARGRKAER